MTPTPINYAEAHDRLKMAVDVLSTHVVGGDSFTVDQERAEAALAYLKGRAEGRADDEEAFATLLEFCFDTGINLDWMYFGTLKGLICASAAKRMYEVAITSTVS